MNNNNTFELALSTTASLSLVHIDKSQVEITKV